VNKPLGHNIRRLPHGNKPNSLAYDQKLPSLIHTVGWSFRGF
jgi:hypothetical protein